MRLTGKVAVVTGASMGIGEALAKLFLNEGARVVLCSRDLERTKAAQQRIGGDDFVAMSVACDVSKRDQIDALVQAALARFGRIDIWVNNAGFGLNDALATLDIAQLRQLFDTNFFGAVECMQAVIPVMRKQGSGDIVNISSVSGHVSTPYASAYSASKFALNAVGWASRMELNRRNINVLTVCPGYIATDFAKNMQKGQQAKRVNASVKYAVGADVVAQATLRGILKRKRQITVPWFYWVVIKVYENFPALMELVMRRSLRSTKQLLAEKEESAASKS